MVDEQVAAYLRDLDDALKALPLHEAKELREQIASHLEEAVTPDMGAAAVRAVLTDLGRPANLVADAARTTPAPNAATVVQLLATRRVRVRRWKIAGIVVAVLAALAAVFVPLGIKWSGIDAPQLDVVSYGFVYGVSQTDVTDSQANGQTQLTLQLRPNTVQAIAYGLLNSTKYTQTILGFDPGYAFLSDGAFQMHFSPEEPTVEMVRNGFTNSAPASIAPGHFRDLLLTWTTAKLPCIMAGGGPILQFLRLRIRVGWVTRTEDISLGTSLEFEGPSGTC